MNGLLISACGRHAPGQVVSAVHRFDPYSLILSERPPLATPRTAAAMTAFEGRVFVCGGDNSHDAQRLASVEVYDPQADEWGVAADLPSA